MKPLIVLLITFAISLFAIKVTTHLYDWQLAGRIAMCAMLCFTAIGHFAFTKGMVMMMPDFIPFKTAIVYLTGMFELIIGVALLIPGFKVYAGCILIAFFILILPANIKAAINHVDYQKATFDGNGLQYLWFRVPLQILFVVWTYFSAVR